MVICIGDCFNPYYTFSIFKLILSKKESMPRQAKQLQKSLLLLLPILNYLGRWIILIRYGIDNQLHRCVKKARKLSPANRRHTTRNSSLDSSKKMLSRITITAAVTWNFMLRSLITA
jgi:hypothetical protein